MEGTQFIKDKAQEFNNKLKEVSEKLELKDKQEILGIDYKDNIKLGGNLERNSVFVVKIKNEKGEISHIVMDKECNKIASIANDGKIELSEKEMQIWEKFIGKKGFQNAEQKKMYNFEEEYYLDEYIEHENVVEGREINKKSKKAGKQEKSNSEPDERKQEVAETLKVDKEEIIAMIKIEDRETFGQAINKKLYADAYIIKYGNNKTQIMQVASNGKLVELSGIESNEFNYEVMEQLNIDKPGDNHKIKAGDLTTIKTEDEKYNYVVVRENNSKRGIVIVNSTDITKVYEFDDEGKNDIKEIETSIKYEVEKKEEQIEDKSKKEKENEDKENQEKDDDDEGRTPWGDAYARRRR